MNTSQILKSIAHKLGITLRVPSSEQQKLEAIRDTLPRFIEAPPYVASVAYTSAAEDTVVLTYSEAVQELGTGQWVMDLVLDDGTVEFATAETVTQTGPAEITLTFAASAGTATFIGIRHASFVTTVLSATTFAPERIGGNYVVWAGDI